MAEKSADDAAALLTSTILEIVDACVPSKWILDKPYAHPWINDQCREALQRKQDARNTPLYALERDVCSSVFLKVYHEYVVKTNETLRTMEPLSKGWWKITNSLLTKRSTGENIPALQRQDGSWAMSADERAKELAGTFRAKSTLPPESTNHCCALHAPQRQPQTGFLRLRVRTVRKFLRSFGERSGTGPDRLPARILKKSVVPNWRCQWLCSRGNCSTTVDGQLAGVRTGCILSSSANLRLTREIIEVCI